MKQEVTRNALTNQLIELEAQLTIEEQEIRFKQKEVATKRGRVKAIKNEIAQLHLPVNPTVSDHALLRYMERFKGLNIGEIAQEILTPSVLQQIETLGSTGTYVNENVRIVVRNNVVVTVK